MLSRVQGLVFLAFGGVAIAEGWHIERDVRAGSNFDAVGPDRYLMAIGALLLVLGLWLSLRPLQLGEKAHNDRLPADVRINLFVTLGMLAAFTLAIPYAGFTLGCFVFLTVLFHRLSDWSWVRSALTAAASSAIFDIALVRLADVPLPAGIIGL
jgi:hypothetical protein